MCKYPFTTDEVYSQQVFPASSGQIKKSKYQAYNQNCISFWFTSLNFSTFPGRQEREWRDLTGQTVFLLGKAFYVHLTTIHIIIFLSEL